MEDEDATLTLLRDATLRQLCAQVTNRPDAPRELRSLAASCLARGQAMDRRARGFVPKDKPGRNHGQTAALRGRVEITPARISAMVEWVRTQMSTEKGNR